MIDWTKSMTQTYEYYIVDPITWGDKELIKNVKSSTINRTNSGTLCSASIDCSESLDECYVRIYLIAVQNNQRYKIPLGTVLVQTPGTDFDGKVQNLSLDAYSPLLELKESNAPIGYAIKSGSSIMETAYDICREHMRAPIVATNDSITLVNNFVSELDDTWFSFLTDFISNASYVFELDELGKVLFSKVQDIESLQPIWTYNDDNSSILYPDITLDRDLYGIPNVVEVIYSNDIGYTYSRIQNDDINSPISIPNRGREIVYRVTDPSLNGVPTQSYLDAYAKQVLINSSSLEYTLSYTHGYCPVRVGDCVLMNYNRAGLKNIKAKVTSQSIKCKSGCSVTENATFTTKLWR